MVYIYLIDCVYERIIHNVGKYYYDVFIYNVINHFGIIAFSHTLIGRLYETP